MNEKKYPEPVEALVVVILILGFILLVAFLLALGMIIPGINISINTKLVFVLGGIPFLIVPLLYVKIRKYDARSIFRLNSIPLNVLMLSVLIGLALGIIGDELDRLIQIILPIPQWFIDQLQFMQADTGYEWSLLITGVVILAALSEEFLFRGFLQVSLERKGDPTRAVLLSSLTWTMVHVNPYWAVQIFIIGVVIGFLAWRTNSILPSLIVHGMNNLLSLIFYNFGDHLHWYLMGNHVSIFILLPAALILVWSIQRVTAIYRPE
jgi:membrane protease YdiL (CAAX protease family)